MDALLDWKSLVLIGGMNPESPAAQRAAEAARQSELAQGLLAGRQSDGTLPYQPYSKWRGAHWVLACLADMCYPPGDASLQPLLDQVYAWLFSKGHQQNIPVIQGRTRRCASQEGNALFSTLALGLSEPRAEQLAENLMRWQWPDGGWNCDRHPKASISSFHESLIPMRALSRYAAASGDPSASRAVKRCAEVFLSRHLFRRRSNGEVIDHNFVQLHYPAYWHYDILMGLKVMAEAGYLGDARCQEALELLKSKRLPDGGWPAEAKYYRPNCGPADTGKPASGCSPVNWGGVSKVHSNPFVTVDVLYVLKSVAS